MQYDLSLDPNDKDAQPLDHSAVVSLVSEQRAQVLQIIKLSFSPSFVAFGQRRFRGFRKRVELDSKRLLLADHANLQLVGFSQSSGAPYNLLATSLEQYVGGGHNLLLLDFALDTSSSLLLLVSLNRENNETSIRVLQVESNSCAPAEESDPHISLEVSRTQHSDEVPV